MSIATTSGIVSAAISIAGPPSSASATTTARPSLSRACRRPIRHTSCHRRSSRVGARLSPPSLPEPPSDSVSQTLAPSLPVPRHRDAELYGGAGTWCADLLDPSSQILFHPLAHAYPPLMVGRRAVGRVVALSLVAHRRQQPRVVNLRENPRAIGFRVLVHVLQSLLHGAAQ